MLYSEKREQNNFYKQFQFKDNLGFFWVSHDHLADWLPHPSIKLWNRLNKVDKCKTRLNKVDKCKAQLSVNLSVIGIYPKSNLSLKSLKDSKYQIIAKKKINAMYETVFEHEQDHKSSSQCIDEYATIAIFLSTGPRKLTNKETIFIEESAENNLICAAGCSHVYSQSMEASQDDMAWCYKCLNIPNPLKHLKVLWLGATNV